MKSSISFSNLGHGGRWGLLLISALTLVSSCSWDHVEQPKVVCFESEVLPLFVTYCSTSGCHNAVDHVEGYDLSTYDGVMRGVDAGRPRNSKVYEAMTKGGEEAMPPSGSPQPTATQVALIGQWITEGANNTTNCATAGCDTSAAVTYSGDIEPVLQTFCIGCHSSGSPSAGLDLTDFNTVKANSQSGRIQGSMTADPNYKTMPPGGALVPSCVVDKIDKWVANGAPHN